MWANQTHLVVYISDVHNEVDLKPKVVAQNAPNDIRRDIVPRMSQVRVVISRGTADIPTDLPLLNRDEWHWRPRLERIVDLQLVHDVKCAGASKAATRKNCGECIQANAGSNRSEIERVKHKYSITIFPSLVHI
jgi:hypothetical protein